MKNPSSIFLLLVFWGGGLLFDSAYASQKETGEADKASAVVDILHRLEKKTSDIKSIRADFIQEKKLAAFQNKLVIRGRICLLKPDKIAWHIDKPIKYSVIITGKFIRQWDEDTNQVQEIPFSKIPVLRIIFDQLRGWLSGNYLSFIEDYAVSISKEEPLVLKFVPKAESSFKAFVDNIEISLQKDERYLKWIKIKSASGDNTIINFTNTILNPPVESLSFEVNRGA